MLISYLNIYNKTMYATFGIFILKLKILTMLKSLVLPYLFAIQTHIKIYFSFA